MEVVASLSQGRTAAAQCGLFTHKSVPVIFEPPCTYIYCTPHIKFEDNISYVFYQVFVHRRSVLIIQATYVFYKNGFLICCTRRERNFTHVVGVFLNGFINCGLPYH